jgi:small GTP-binding protein
MLKIPSTLNELRSLLKVFDRESLSLGIEEETRSRLAVVGPVNSGKSTLINLLLGKRVSAVSAVPGTTKEVATQRLGPFTLIDTPGFGEVNGVERGETALAAMREADLAVLVFDAAAGLRREDYELYQSLRGERIPLIVALNKIDLIGRDLPLVVSDVQSKLGDAVVPISAKKGTNVATQLLPRVVQIRPALAVALGRELPFYRRRMARSVIRNASMLNLLIGMEPIPFLDIPLLLASQMRMTLRIATIYGQSLGPERARELITTIGGGVLLRYATQQALKFLPGPGWVISGSIAAAGTWAMGQVAVAYFESSERLSSGQMRALYGKLTRPRPGDPFRVFFQKMIGPWLGLRDRLRRKT